MSASCQACSHPSPPSRGRGQGEGVFDEQDPPCPDYYWALSTLPIFFTTSASRAASLAHHALNSSASM